MQDENNNNAMTSRMILIAVVVPLAGFALLVTIMFITTQVCDVKVCKRTNVAEMAEVRVRLTTGVTSPAIPDVTSGDEPEVAEYLELNERDMTVNTYDGLQTGHLPTTEGTSVVTPEVNHNGDYVNQAVEKPEVTYEYMDINLTAVTETANASNVTYANAQPTPTVTVTSVKAPEDTTYETVGDWM